MQKTTRRLSRREIGELVVKFKRAPTYFLSQIQDPLISQLLELHYIKGLEWWKVANAINYSEQNVYKLRRRALATLADIIGKEDKTHGTKDN